MMVYRISNAAAAKFLNLAAGTPGGKKPKGKRKLPPVIPWEAWGIEAPTPEFQFAPPRKWRFDWCWKTERLALEVDGGAFSGGRHVRGKGFIADQEKRNAAVLAGFRVLHCVPADLESGAIFETIRKALRIE